MAEGIFGKSGSISFTAVTGYEGKIVAPYALVSMSIYSDTPTDAQVADDSDSLSAASFHTNAAWFPGFEDNEKLIAYDAIDDPEPNSSFKWENYYAVVRYRLENAEQIQRDTVSLILHRASVITSRFAVAVDDISVLERKIPTLLTHSQVEAKILVAGRFVANALRSRGVDMKRLEWASGKDLVRFKATKLCCMDLSSDSSDEWAMKADSYHDTYTRLLEDLVLTYDADNDGDTEPSETVQTRNSQVVLYR